jgi:hypothetical protein
MSFLRGREKMLFVVVEINPKNIEVVRGGVCRRQEICFLHKNHSKTITSSNSLAKFYSSIQPQNKFSIHSKLEKKKTSLEAKSLF